MKFLTALFSKKTERVEENGVIWTIMSNTERKCTAAGRHFVANRSSKHSEWYLSEIDRDANEIGYLNVSLDTILLSPCVLFIVDRDQVMPTR